MVDFFEQKKADKLSKLFRVVMKEMMNNRCCTDIHDKQFYDDFSEYFIKVVDLYKNRDMLKRN